MSAFSIYRAAIISTIWSTALLSEATAAQAQAADATTPTEASARNPTATAPSTTVQASTDSERQSSPGFHIPHPELRLGPFDIQPRLTAEVTFDDNILIASHNPESDVIWAVQPAFLAVAGDRLAIEDYKRQDHNVLGFTPDTFIVSDQANWPGRTFLLDYGPRFNEFTTHSENDSIDELLSASLLWPMSKLMLGFRQDYRLENTTVVEAGRRTSQEIINTDVMSGYQFSEKTSAEINLYRHGLNYEVQDLNGFTDWADQNWFNYQLTPLLNVGTGITVGTFDVQTQGQQTYEQFLGRARYQFHERLNLDASFGLAVRQAGGGRPESFEPVFTLTGYYRPTDSTTIMLSGYRREQPSVYYGANYITTGGSIGLRQQFLERYFLDMGFDYSIVDYLTSGVNPLANRVDDYLYARIGLEVRFTRHLIGSISYLFRSVESNQWDGFTNNQIVTHASFTF